MSYAVVSIALLVCPQKGLANKYTCHSWQVFCLSLGCSESLRPGGMHTHADVMTLARTRPYTLLEGGLHSAQWPCHRTLLGPAWYRSRPCKHRLKLQIRAHG